MMRTFVLTLATGIGILVSVQATAQDAALPAPASAAPSVTMSAETPSTGSVTTQITTETNTGTAETVTSETVVVDNPNIVEVAIRNPELSMFVEAVAAAGLTATLQADGPYTVFAPTNDAFAKIPEWQRDNWKKPENKEKLAAILKHHVISGIVGSPEAKGSIKETITLQGDKIKVDGEGDAILLDGVAKVVKPDITVRNGIIHEVDTIIVPKE